VYGTAIKLQKNESGNCKIFANNFITTLLGIFPHEIEKAFFTLGLGPIFGPKNAVGKSLYM
jgi:hypothetical protein